MKGNPMVRIHRRELDKHNKKESYGADAQKEFLLRKALQWNLFGQVHRSNSLYNSSKMCLWILYVFP